MLLILGLYKIVASKLKSYNCIKFYFEKCVATGF